MYVCMYVGMYLSLSLPPSLPLYTYIETLNSDPILDCGCMGAVLNVVAHEGGCQN